MRDALQATGGVMRSLRIYYGDRARRAAMRVLYGAFIEKGDLVFDIGAHVGDRVACFRRLGSRVVAVEPQPALVRTLRLLYGRDPEVTIERAGDRTHARQRRAEAQPRQPDDLDRLRCVHRRGTGAPGWRASTGAQAFRPDDDARHLIAHHGLPRFIKIDVEGFEEDALIGPDAAGRGAVVRIHHHSARRRARLPRRAASRLA